MLRLTRELRREIEAHGEQGYPDEVCGFLLGRTEAEEQRTVTRLVRIENTWDEAGNAEFAVTGTDFAGASRRRRFKIPPEGVFSGRPGGAGTKRIDSGVLSFASGPSCPTERV